MKMFCTYCGAEQDVSPGSKVKCPACAQEWVVPGPAAPSHPQGKPTSTGAIVAVVLLVGGFGTLVVVGILAAIAIPNFIKFQARSKQGEVKSNLKGLYVSEKTYFLDHDKYATALGELDFAASRGNRYAYFLDPVGPLEDRTQAKATGRETAAGIGVDSFKNQLIRPIVASDLPATVANIGVTGTCPACQITLVGAARLREGNPMDVWSISSAPRELRGRTVAAGEPYNDVDGL